MLGASPRTMRDYDLSTQPTPDLERLSAEGEEAIHEASMEIIEEIGIKLNHEDALDVFEEHGATVDRDENLVTIDRGIVEERVDQAPESFTLHGRDPEKSIRVGGDGGSQVRAPGYGPPNIRTFTDGRRSSQLADYEDLVKLTHMEDVINCTGYNVCEPNDVDQEVKHYEMVKRSLTMSDQPLMASTYGSDRAEACLDMVGIAVDDPDLSKPYVAGLINTVPPRSLDTKMLGGLMTYAEHGQPPVISSFTMAGASGPASLAGSLAQANAENLVGITLAQLVNPGTPVVYGVPSSNIDVRYGSLSIGSPESGLFISFAGQMGRYYGIPSRAGGSLSDTKTIDYQGGFESMLTLATTVFSGIDYVLHSAGILESYSTISPEKFVLDCEMIRYLDRFTRGYDINAENFALDLIADVDPASHFLSQRHTLEHSKTEFFRPEVVDKRSHGDWSDDGEKTAFEMGRDRVSEQLAAYERPALDPDIEADLEAYVESGIESAD